MEISDAKAKIRSALVPTLMSSDEECDDGFITHQPSWQSDKFKTYKQKLDSKYLTACSNKSRTMLQGRVIGATREKEVPELKENDIWIVNIER